MGKPKTPRLAPEEKAVALRSAAAMLHNWIDTGMAKEGEGLSEAQIRYVGIDVANMLHRKAYAMTRDL